MRRGAAQHPVLDRTIGTNSDDRFLLPMPAMHDPLDAIGVRPHEKGTLVNPDHRVGPVGGQKQENPPFADVKLRSATDRHSHLAHNTTGSDERERVARVGQLPFQILDFHQRYLRLDPARTVEWAGGPLAVSDCFGILSDADIQKYFELGCEVKALGRGHIQRIKEQVRTEKGAEYQVSAASSI